MSIYKATREAIIEQLESSRMTREGGGDICNSIGDSKQSMGEFQSNTTQNVKKKQDLILDTIIDKALSMDIILL